MPRASSIVFQLPTITTTSTAIFQVNLGYPILPRASSSTCSGRECFRTSGTVFHGRNVLLVTQPTVSKHGILTSLVAAKKTTSTTKQQWDHKWRQEKLFTPH